MLYGLAVDSVERVVEYAVFFYATIHFAILRHVLAHYASVYLFRIRMEKKISLEQFLALVSREKIKTNIAFSSNKDSSYFVHFD